MNAGIKRNDVLVALHVATLVSNATVRASQLGWLLGKKGFVLVLFLLWLDTQDSLQVARASAKQRLFMTYASLLAQMPSSSAAAWSDPALMH